MADISKIITPDGGVYTLKDTSARDSIANLAKVATSGSYNDLSNKPTIPSKTSQLTNDSNYLTTSSSLNPENISSGYLLKRQYINTHPENGGSLIPFLSNDWAFLTTRGGTCNAYTTSSTDYLSKNTLTVKKQYSTFGAWFDGSSSYGSFTVDATTEVMIIDITPPETLSYSCLFYIDFGATAWQAKDISLYAWNNNAENFEQGYRRLGYVTGQNRGHWYLSTSYTWYKDAAKTVVGSYGANKYRIVLTNWQGKSPRIAQIGLVYYGSSQQRMTTMSRGIDDKIWRSITPDKNNTYNLGTSSNKWSNVYATTFTGNLTGNVTGNVSGSSGSCTGNAATATNATKVNNHTVESDVPANAKFTDTVYTLPAATSSALGGVKIGSNITNSSGTISLSKSNVTAALGYTPATETSVASINTLLGYGVENLIVKENVYLNTRLAGSGGNYEHNGYFCTMYIPVTPNTSYTVSWTPTTMTRVSYYDATGTYLSRNDTDKTFTTPANCSLIRVGATMAELDTAYLRHSDNRNVFNVINNLIGRIAALENLLSAASANSLE